jgi:hypothetical protein
MLKRAPNQGDGSAMDDNGDQDDAVAAPQQRGVKCQMQGLARLFQCCRAPWISDPNNGLTSIRTLLNQR